MTSAYQLRQSYSARTYDRIWPLVLLCILLCPTYSLAQLTPPTQQHNPLAQAHRSSGDKHHAAADYPAARREYQAAYAIDRNNPAYRRDAGIDLRKIGNSYADRDKYVQAMDFYQQALSIARQVNDAQGQADAICDLGNTQKHFSHYDTAIADYQQALAIYQQSKNIDGQARTLVNLGNVYDRLNQYDKTIDYDQQALPLLRQLNDRIGQIQLLNHLGKAFDELSQYDKAIAFLQQALSVTQQIQNVEGQAVTRNNLGNVYLDLAQYAQALNCYQQAFILQKKSKNQNGQADALNNLGNTSNDLNQFDKAIEYYQQALTITKQSKDLARQADVRNNLGTVYKQLSQYQQAVYEYQQALSIYQQSKDIDGQARTLVNLGNTYDRLNQDDKSMAFLQNALALFQQLNDLNGQANVFLNLGASYDHLGQHEKAISFQQQALPIFQQVKNREGESLDLSDLMTSWSDLAMPQLAIFYGKQAVNVYQSIRYDLLGMDKQAQTDYLRAIEPTYRILAGLLIQQKRVPEAIQILNMLKQEEYLNFTQNTREGTALLAEQAQLTSPEAIWNTQYQAATGQKVQATLALIQTEASHVDIQQNRLDVQADVIQLQQTLTQLGHHTVAIYTLVGDNALSILLVTPTKSTAYNNSITGADVEKKINAFRDALQDPTHDPRALGQELYDLLTKPMEADLKAANAQTLMWSLDGSLRYIPIAALYDGKQYLVERYTNTLFSPASDTQLTADPQAHWTGLGMGVSLAHPGFDSLSNVPAELDSVIHDPQIADSQAGALPGTILLDTAFTQTTLVNGLAHHDPLVHIASHFAFQPGDAKDSFLLLGDGNHLSLADIQAMPDDLLAGVNLLTLSACETAADGEGANGKEVENLAVLAQRKGAQAVMATLWSVDDAATQQLMHDFYDDRQSGAGMSKGDALRQAQLAILGDASLARATAERGANRAEIVPGKKDRSVAGIPYHLDPAHPQVHPYYWAPFILIGNWK